MARKGRGRLSSIDLLPEEAGEIVAWAAQKLQDREREQKDILDEFNDRLAQIGEGPISSSAFNRHSMKLAAMTKRMNDVGQITKALSDRMEPGQSDDLTIMASEAIKTLIFELLTDNPDLTPKAALELARGLQAAVAAQKMPVQRKREKIAEFAEQVDGALEAVKEEAGLTADTMARIRKEFLGLRE